MVFPGLQGLEGMKIDDHSLRRAFRLLRWAQSKHIEQVTTEVPELPLVPVESACSSRSGCASGSSGPVGKLRKERTDLDCARSSVDALFVLLAVSRHMNSRLLAKKYENFRHRSKPNKHIYIYIYCGRCSRMLHRVGWLQSC